MICSSFDMSQTSNHLCWTRAVCRYIAEEKIDFDDSFAASKISDFLMNLNIINTENYDQKMILNILVIFMGANKFNIADNIFIYNPGGRSRLRTWIIRRLE